MTCPWFLSWEKYYQGNPGPSHIFSSHISKCFPVPRRTVGSMAGSAVWGRERLRKHSVVLWEDGGKMFSVGGSHRLCKWMLPRMKPQSWTRSWAGVAGGLGDGRQSCSNPSFVGPHIAFLLLASPLHFSNWSEHTLVRMWLSTKASPSLFFLFVISLCILGHLLLQINSLLFYKIPT